MKGAAMTMRGALLALCLLVPASAQAADSDWTETLKHWLTLVDKAQYGDSWGTAGTLLRSQITQKDWTARVGKVRAPLGAMTKRSVLDQKYVTSLPGLPDADYEIVRFNTVFQNKPAAVETVILQREDKGWKVDGYFVK